VPQSVP